MAVYLRFVVNALDPDSGRRQGLFQAARRLDTPGGFSAEDVVEYDAIRNWFNDNLERPSQFAISRRPHAKGQVIGWFKSEALAHIDRMRDFARLLQAHGVIVETLRTERPGYIVYEDEHQVAAYPFADTPT